MSSSRDITHSFPTGTSEQDSDIAKTLVKGLFLNGNLNERFEIEREIPTEHKYYEPGSDAQTIFIKTDIKRWFNIQCMCF